MRKILIDTHVFLWYAFVPEKLKKEHLKVISDEKTIVYVSVASLFEINIKRGISKLSFQEPLKEIIEVYGFKLLSIEYPHLEKLREIDFMHKDPFDKMIIAQAISEDMEIMSYDGQFKNYPLRLV
jgi:PIN domain nuclease of toxin-antitoxin system